MDEGEQTPLRLEEKLRLLPDSPGVYLMKDGKGEVLYVGKSKCLKDRVRSYFQKTRPTSPRIRKMTERVENIETLVTRSELDALILENTLIKKYRPRFNVLFRDDKTYPYLRFSWSEDFPRLSVTRRVSRSPDLTFGPYANPGALRETLGSISRIFPLATCSLDLGKTIDRPCIEYQIGRCMGPCAGLVTREEYRRMADGVRLFLEGKNSDLETLLHNEMVSHAKNLEFEKAAKAKHRLESIRTILERQTVEFRIPSAVDAVAVETDEGSAQIELLSVRNGRIAGRREVHIRNFDQDSPDDLLMAFLEQHYSQETTALPEEILLSHPLSHEALMNLEWMAEKKGGKVIVTHPRRGEKKTVVELAQNNARASLKERGKSQSDLRQALEEVREMLGLEHAPASIGCVDISNTGDSFPVASLVVFVDGLPEKSLYRRFRIRYDRGQDDFRMLAEVLSRHFDERPLPDLLLIDGGEPQLRAALAALHQIGKAPRPRQVIGIAKERSRTGHLERLVSPEFDSPLILPPHRPATHLLMRVRDEAHRFAITYHRKLREEALTHSRLLDIPGIGPSREKQLLLTFGSVDELKSAGPERIAREGGLPASLARRIAEHLSEAASPAPPEEDDR